MTDLALPTAADCMSTRLLTFSPQQDLFEAIEALLKNSYAAAPVVDEDDNLLGMLTEKDCLRLLSNLAYGNEFTGGRVEDYMSAIRVICEPTMDIFRVAEMFLATNFPLLPVVDGGRLCGVISRRDTLRGVRKLRQKYDRKQISFEQTAGHQADRPRSIEEMQRVAANTSPSQLSQLFKR